MKKNFCFFITILLVISLTLGVSAQNFAKKEANFSIIYQELEIPFQSFSIFVMPAEAVEIEIAEKNRDKKYIIEFEGKSFENNKSFKWQAPAKSGHYPVLIKEKNGSSDAAKIKLNLFVLHPNSEKKGEYLNGFRIGNYPEIPAAKKYCYSKPKGFLEINKSLLELNLSPHFKMRQFLTNQCDELPHYIVLKETLLLKLEYFLQELNQEGYYAETFGIVSGYRSPYLNKKIGNKTSLSRHLFGDAADIYVDNSGNNWMDDLNHDDKINRLDAELLFDIAVKFDNKAKYKKLQGGLGSYSGNGIRGPFIHIDTRGHHVSW